MFTISDLLCIVVMVEEGNNMEKLKLTVFASGTKDGGGSGFEKLVEAMWSGVLDAEIVAVVSNHELGGVHDRAKRLRIPFEYFPKPWTGARYEAIVKKYDAQYVALSGWLKLVKVCKLGFWWSPARFLGFNKGLDPRYTFNIHPALLSQLGGAFGGHGMYGHHAHKAVTQAVHEGKIWKSGFSMHFVTEYFDDGPVFAEIESESLGPLIHADQVGKIVNALEHKWQSRITNMVVHGEISWDGVDPKSLKVPNGYQFLPKPN